jgi:hypothetical protein
MTGMDELPIGVIGEIVAGVDVGRFVEIVDDAENTGGFLVVTYADADRSPEVFDSWLESIVDVELYFEELGWRVQWQERA